MPCRGRLTAEPGGKAAHLPRRDELIRVDVREWGDTKCRLADEFGQDAAGPEADERSRRQDPGQPPPEARHHHGPSPGRRQAIRSV